jgi:RNA recognition motif-containing protein
VRRVRVDGLGANTTEDNLSTHFARFGTVEGVKVIRGEHAFVTFSDEAAASKALGASGSSLNGGSLSVSLDTGRTRARRTGRDAEGGAGARRAAPEPEASNTLWIGGLPQTVTEAGVRAAVQRYAAQIDSVTVQEARGGSTKFAYVQFKTVDGAVAASAALQGVKVEGAEGKVALAQARRTGGRRE